MNHDELIQAERQKLAALQEEWREKVRESEVDISLERVAAGRLPLFQSHMLDASAIPMEENLALADQLLEECAELDIVLELEIGVVGGEEDGVSHDVPDAKLYTTPDDMLEVHRRMSAVPGTFISARKRSDRGNSTLSTRQKSRASPGRSSSGWRRPRRRPTPPTALSSMPRSFHAQLNV